MILGNSTRDNVSMCSSNINHNLLTTIQGTIRRGVRQRKEELALIVFMYERINSLRKL